MRRYIYLFRHAQTFDNEGGAGDKKKFSGWRDSRLSSNGVKNARILARKLKKVKFEVAYQSRLTRSKDTLKEVLKFHPECKKIINDDRIIERNYGNLQGYMHKTIIEKYGMKKFRQWRRGYDTPPPRGESIKMVERRVKSFIKDLIKFMKKNKVNVAISAHGNSMRPFRRYFERVSIKKMVKWEMPYDNYFRYSVNV